MLPPPPTPGLACRRISGNLATFFTVLADYYLHHFDPIVVQFTERLAIRWYGIAYVLGFIGGFALLLKLVRLKCSELRPDQVGDFITYGAIFGVMLGGRLGYMLFYDFDRFIHDPLMFFNFLSGGMANHGAVVGLILFTWVYARMHRLSWAGLGDNLVVVVPIGVFFGRVANFINGELYGRITSVPWAVKFPTELTTWTTERVFDIATRCASVSNAFAVRFAELQQARQLGEIDSTPKLGYYTAEAMIESGRDDEAVAGVLRESLPPRHPSQLYEALLEGLVLLAILLWVRLRWKNLSHGILTGLYFVLYAVFRIAVEFYRQPDHDKTQFGVLTRGQFYSLFMIVIGIGFFVYAARVGRKNAEPAPLPAVEA